MTDLHDDISRRTASADPADPGARAAAGRRLARVGLAAAMISRLASRLVGIILVVLLAREASAEVVAVYGYLLGTATLVLVLTDLGVATVAGREVAAGRLPAEGTLRAALGIQAVSVAAAALATVALTLLWGPDQVPGSALALTVAFVVSAGMTSLWAELLRATGRVVLEGALQLGSAVLLVGVGAVVVASGGSVTTLMVVVVGKEVLVLAVAACLLRPRRTPGVRARDLLGQGLWLAVAGTAIVLLWRQGTLAVGELGTLGVLATYVVATRFLDAGVTVAHTAGIGLVPGMSALAVDPAAFRRAGRRYLAVVSGAGLLVAAAGLALARPLTTIPFGAEWSSAVPAVRWVSLAALPILVCHICFTLLLARHQMRWLAGSALVGSVTGIAASIALLEWRPSAECGVAGTALGATVMAVLLLAGLRDVLLAPRPPAATGHDAA